VTDFNVGEGDVLQLKGKASDYSLGQAPQGFPGGRTLVYEGGNSPEVVAIIQGDTNISLESSSVQYV